MAFMMPVMKNNYPLYAQQSGKQQKENQRRTSETDAMKKSKAQQIPNGGSAGMRRKVRSEGPSLSTSPGSGSLMINPNSQASLRGQPPKGLRVRGSAPVLGQAALPLHRHNSLPHGPHPVVGSAPTKTGMPVSPSRSDSSSESSEPPSPTQVTGKFHLKLIQRLRRSLRIKDPAPPQEAVSTA